MTSRGGAAGLLTPGPAIVRKPGLRTLRDRLAAAGVDGATVERTPFALDDATGGAETELQASVTGARDAADLPLTIEASNYFANVIRRAAAGDTPKRAITALEAYLDNNPEGVWDNSWVRFPKRLLTPYAASVLDNDLRADKSDPASPLRGDAAKFHLRQQGEEFLRLPVSYLLKLSLADCLGAEERLPEAVRATGVRLMGHFLNDNTSPETYSFHTCRLTRRTGRGRSLARETARRYLFSQLLAAYANRAFELRRRGQEAVVFSSPHPPVRQRDLNDCISDSFYRELFMSPCLSGWDRGEAKRDYMALCHQTLSRSQLNAVAKLREAGIITRNLVVLPNTSNISLANNGTHVSLGSRKLGELLSGPGSGFGAAEEKRLGDLVIKIAEHFLPLFVGVYCGAPYRLDFADFHPEKALGFLPHQLDYTHLRMLWRRWQGKARNRVFGKALSPLGPQPLDRLITAVFRLKGDYVPDFRLIDYFVSPMSTESSPALDGSPGNEQRLLRDLDDLGVFDARMTLYSLYRLRSYGSRGFSGFEGRHYSLFENLGADMAHAVNLQTLVTAYAYRLAASGAVTHAHIPDRPSLESERRQIIFGAAAGTPTFFVHKASSNAFLLEILSLTRRTRSSRRYPGRIRVYHSEYQQALVRVLERDAADLIEAMGFGRTLEDLKQRLAAPEEASAAARLMRGILSEAGARSPFDLRAREFNLAAERYYRETLRRKQIEEALDFLEQDLAGLRAAARLPEAAEALHDLFPGMDAASFVPQARKGVLEGRAPAEELRRLIGLLLVLEHCDAKEAAA